MTDTATDSVRRANIIGVGLIGGSVALALRSQGWHVSGDDRDAATLDLALQLEVIDATGIDPSAEITFVATPVGGVVEAAERALAETSGIVTDVGSVKQAIALAIDNPRFVAGHPMAGSEQDGVAGARPGLFNNATWVITPTETTSDDAYTVVRQVVRTLGAEVVSMEPELHDVAVARISHVPHLTAATMMVMAAGNEFDNDAVLRLAAGGFRDMTRIAAGHPAIWLDICEQNKDSIVESLDDLISGLLNAKQIVETTDRDALRSLLTGARTARVNLPTGIPNDLDLCEVRVTMPDVPGAIASLTTLAPEINIYDFEIAHSAEGGRGVAIMVVALDDYEAFSAKLTAESHRFSMRKLQ